MCAHRLIAQVIAQVFRGVWGLSSTLSAIMHVLDFHYTLPHFEKEECSREGTCMIEGNF